MCVRERKKERERERERETQSYNILFQIVIFTRQAYNHRKHLKVNIVLFFFTHQNHTSKQVCIKYNKPTQFLLLSPAPPPPPPKKKKKQQFLIQSEFSNHLSSYHAPAWTEPMWHRMGHIVVEGGHASSQTTWQSLAWHWPQPSDTQEQAHSTSWWWWWREHVWWWLP